jgi:protein-S-isoprenylcysteine O-methyltransferase Ste14
MLREILREVNIWRLTLGYLVGATIFLFLLPLLFIKIAHFLDTLLKLSPFLPTLLRYFLSLPLLLFGLFWAMWSNIALLFQGRGGPTEGFGVAISPPTKRLVVEGPYKYTRNPMVFGTLTMYLAIGLYLASLTYVFFIVPSFWLATYIILSRSEERRLVREFGVEYLEYKRQVPMYIPWRFLFRVSHLFRD